MRGSGLGHWVSSSSSAQASLASSNCALFSRTAAIVQSITTESNHVPRTVFRTTLLMVSVPGSIGIAIW